MSRRLSRATEAPVSGGGLPREPSADRKPQRTTKAQREAHRLKMLAYPEAVRTANMRAARIRRFWSLMSDHERAEELLRRMRKRASTGRKVRNPTP
jgi:hypothetical protein